MDLKEEESDVYIILQDRSDKNLYKIKDPKLSPEEEDLVSKNIESIFTIQDNENSENKENSEEKPLTAQTASEDSHTTSEAEPAVADQHSTEDQVHSDANATSSDITDENEAENKLTAE